MVLYGYYGKVILAFRKVYTQRRFSTLQAHCKNELLSFLKEIPRKLDVVVMPDFFLDRLISLDCDAAGFFSMVKDAADRKGGSIDGITQTDIRGGNAINTAS